MTSLNVATVSIEQMSNEILTLCVVFLLVVRNDESCLSSLSDKPDLSALRCHHGGVLAVSDLMFYNEAELPSGLIVVQSS
jgi:hypothetical protein